MKLLSANTGSYPKIGSDPKKQKFRVAYAKWEAGELSDEQFKKIQDEVVKEVIDEQIQAGLDMVTDGQIRWIDPISHFTKNLEGCRMDGLLRYFDTNFYFRQPVVTSRLVIKHPVACDEFVFAKRYSSVPVKQVITGPYTLARLSINRAGVDFRTFLRWFTEVVAQEVHAISRLGRCFVQIDEPAILSHPKDWELFKESIEEICSERRRLKIYLYTYFGDAMPLLNKMENLPVNGVGFDFTYSWKLVQKMAEEGFAMEAVGLGLIDGRNTRMERKRKILGILRRLLRNLNVEIVYLNPSCGLEFLPRENAFKKLKLVSEICKEARQKIL